MRSRANRQEDALMGEGSDQRAGVSDAVASADTLALGRHLRIDFFRAVAGANLLGAVVVFLFLAFIAPIPDEVERGSRLFGINALVFAGYMLIALPLGIVWGRALAAPIERWLEEQRAPTAAEVAHTLRFPLAGFRLMGTLWTVAAALFFGVNASFSITFAALQAFTIALGGVITSMVVVLAAERALRNVIVLALASGVPQDPVGPKIRVRMVLTWTLTTGIPLVAIVLVSATVLVGVDVTPRRLATTALFLAALGLTVGLIGMVLVARSLAEPVEEVRTAMSAVESGDLRAQVPVGDASEVGLLVAGFNRMVAGLRERERLRDVFGRHVGREVARTALDAGTTLGGEVREIGVMFVDLAGSTELAARRDPAEVVTLLNQFFRIVVEVTDGGGGWVNKFQGDAALCVFGAPLASPDPAGDALRAGRKLRDRLGRELVAVEAGIGISAGPAVAGHVGTEERFEYTVIGNPVNEAARLCDLAKHRPELVLASEEALTRAHCDEVEHWALEAEVVLRGKPEATRLATTR